MTGILDQQIEPISNVDGYAVVLHRQHDFDVGTEATLGEVVTQTSPIGALKESWPKRGMDANRGPYDLPRHIIQFHH